MRLPLSRRTIREGSPPIAAACLSLVALLGLQLPAPGGLPEPPGRPDISNTGVPAGTVLRPSGPLVVTEDGTVIDGLDVQGCVQVKADRVTIRRTRIRCDSWYGVRVHDGFRGTQVEDVEIDGRGFTGSVGVSGSSLTLRRADIHDVGDGVRVGSNSLYEQNFIHDLAIGGGSHNDGMQVAGPATNVTIRGNTIVHVRRQTSAIIVKADRGPISDVLIEGNRLNGGTYTLYVYSTPEHVTRDATVRHNRLGRDHVYGPIATKDPQGLRWEGNVWLDTGEPIPPPPSAEEPKPRPGSSLPQDELAPLRGLLRILSWLASLL